MQKKVELENFEDFELLLYDEKDENEHKKFNNKININIFDSQKKKVVNYKLFNEEEDLLLCKEEVVNEVDEENIKIKELYNGEDNDSYYHLNKNETKKKLLKNASEFERKFSHSRIDNQNKEEMEKLYKEIQLKHPRKIINGKIRRYSYFSWSGFFFCNKDDYLSLGLGYVSYFNTLKLLIIFFFIISFINIFSININTKFSSSFDGFKDNILLKTTLGNTISGYFNTNYVNYSGQDEHIHNYLYIPLDYDKNILGNVYFIYRFYDIEKDILKNMNKPYIEFYKFYKKKMIPINYDENSENIKVFHYDYLIRTECAENSSCLLEYYIEEREKKKTFYDVFYYSCFNDIQNYNKDDYKKKFSKVKTTTIFTSLFTLIVLIILYYTYKKAISTDNKKYQKNNIFINNYTLVLHNLKIISEDYNQELNDLISFLNNFIKNYNNSFIQNIKSSNEISGLNIFDVSISNVNEKKIDIFQKIKKLQKKIEDIKNDNDSITKKFKNNIREIYHSAHNIIINFSDKDDNEEENEDNIINNDLTLEKSLINNEEKQKKIERSKTKIKETKNNVTVDIEKLHKECNLKYYADIYITFRNQLIANFLYKKFKKSKFLRFFYYFFCQKHKIKQYYYKNQWLNFDLANENPSEIQWENCYIPFKKKCGRRLLSIIISFLFILIVLTIIYLLNSITESNLIMTIFITLLIQVINVCSILILSKLTKLEKYSTESKNISSDTIKYYWLNFLISGIFAIIGDYIFIFNYLDSENYFVQNKVIIINMICTIFTSQLSPLFFYIWNLLKRFIDSKYNNGKTTKLKDKIKYEEIYIGPEFPFAEKYAKIFVNLSICLLYGINCPILFIFFDCFLILTFIVDKYLIINYYKKPPFYGIFLPKKVVNYLYGGIFLYIFGLIYNFSNPYLFDNELLTNQLYDYNDELEEICLIFNPTFYFYEFFYFDSVPYKTSFAYYGFNISLLIHILIFLIFFINPTSAIKKKLSPKDNILLFSNITPIEIGNLYSQEELKKYYEIKKIQLFDLIIDCENKNKIKDNYSYLINNYMDAIKYIKQNIDKKYKEHQNITDIQSEAKEDEYSELKDENIFKNNILHLTGDISYNQSFIPKYEIYNNFSLMKNL